MRQYLRQSCDDIWVIDCSPEGHQPEVNTRIFQGVQQPVCIVLASRSEKNDAAKPASVRFRALPAGLRTEKFAALADVKLEGSEWVDCPSSWRAPFLPASHGEWSTFPALEDLFIYNGSGVQPKRTWVIAPDADTLIERWQRLVGASDDAKEDLFHATLRNGKPADRHIRSVVEGLPGFEPKPMPLIQEKGACPTPVLYGFRSFNRQWIIPDSRVITQPNSLLWESRSDRQVFLTALSRTSPLTGPALTFTELPPDLDHYNGRGGRIFPLWRNRSATASNVRPALLAVLSEHYGAAVGAEDVVAYIAAVASHPAFTERFQKDLSTPGLRIPVTADRGLFEKAIEIGRAIIWLQTFGERMTDPALGRPVGAPRLPPERRPMIPKEGSIPIEPGAMPDEMSYDATTKRLRVGPGYVKNVDPAVWNYEVSGKRVLLQWFSYRKKNREHPLIGDRRPPSPLGDIQPDRWLPEYTSDLIDVLNVLSWLVDLEPAQAELLKAICSGPTISAEELHDAGAFELPTDAQSKPGKALGPSMFNEMGIE